MSEVSRVQEPDEWPCTKPTVREHDGQTGPLPEVEHCTHDECRPPGPTVVLDAPERTAEDVHRDLDQVVAKLSSKLAADPSPTKARSATADRDIPEEMPPVPCPDCMHPTEHDGDVFLCSNCGQAFSTPNGMDLNMWQELWRAWTVHRQIVALPEPDGTSYEGDPMWGAHVDYEDIIFACVQDGHPVVDGPIGEEPLPAEVADLYGLRLLAAAREARRLASESGVGGGV